MSKKGAGKREPLSLTPGQNTRRAIQQATQPQPFNQGTSIEHTRRIAMLGIVQIAADTEMFKKAGFLGDKADPAHVGFDQIQPVTLQPDLSVRHAIIPGQEPQ